RARAQRGPPPPRGRSEKNRLRGSTDGGVDETIAEAVVTTVQTLQPFDPKLSANCSVKTVDHVHSDEAGFFAMAVRVVQQAFHISKRGRQKFQNPGVNVTRIRRAQI